jgi:hypothetical protein
VICDDVILFDPSLGPIDVTLFSLIRLPRTVDTALHDGEILSLSERSESLMTAADFRRIALSLEGVEEYSHAGLPAFRVGGRKFASLASQAEGYGNLMLPLEQQAAFVEEAPEIFLPIPGGWGKMGHTHIRLAAASEDVLTGALKTAWKMRVDKNAKTSRKRSHAAARSGAGHKRRGIDDRKGKI